MKAAICFFIVFLTSLASARQNLCNEAKARGFDFAADPSDCTRYLYCQRDSADPNDETNIKSVYYLQCNQTSAFKYFKDGTCISDDSHCQGALDLCPPSGTAADYKIANDFESYNFCNQYRYCRLPGMTTSKCDQSVTSSPSRFQFDRNTGTCVDNVYGLRLPNCARPYALPPCYFTSPNFIGYIGSSSPSEDVGPGHIHECDKWYFCFEQTTYDEGVCPCGQEFDSINNPCKISPTPLDYCPYTITGQWGPCPARALSSQLKHL